jgi:hypothetical protein
MTTPDVQRRFRMHPETAAKYLNHLADNGKIERITINNRVFWQRIKREDEEH